MIGRMQSYKDKGMYDAFKKEGKDDNKFSRMAGAFGGLLQKAGGFQPYDEKSEYMKSLLSRPFGGRAIPGSTQRLAGGLTMTRPAAFEPIITPGGGGGYQGRSTGQQIAGAASGAFQGFQAGAATGIPHLAGIGAVVGGIGGLFG